MDQPFFTGDASMHPLGAAKRGETKGAVARGLLAEFVASRKDDMFGMVVFSSNPVEVLPLTQKQAAVQAAIEAGDIGRGLAETDVGTGLEYALRYFHNRPYTGSRIVVLVSDGAATLNLGTQHRIKNLMQRNRVALYWIYLRTRNSISLLEKSDNSSALKLAPQQALHRFFSKADIPYRAYMAENPQELKQAIEDVGRLQNLPIRYQDVIPRHDLSNRFYAITFVLLALLAGFKFFEVRAWR